MSSSTSTSTSANVELDALGEDEMDLATGLTRGDLRRAALATCAAATDVDDARDLLEALGLLDALRGPARLAV